MNEKSKLDLEDFDHLNRIWNFDKWWDVTATENNHDSHLEKLLW